MELIDKEALVQDLLDKSFYPAIVRRAIEQQPAIDAVEVVHAGWQSHGDFFTSYLKCPVCEKSICAYADNGDGQRFDYCPNCGAKMDGRKKEES